MKLLKGETVRQPRVGQQEGETVRQLMGETVRQLRGETAER